jgi:hypothetical protein
VNIDSGFNGGHMAGLIAHRAGKARLQAQLHQSKGHVPSKPAPTSEQIEGFGP